MPESADRWWRVMPRAGGDGWPLSGRSRERLPKDRPIKVQPGSSRPAGHQDALDAREQFVTGTETRSLRWLNRIILGKISIRLLLS
jgi:hypothetical protein